MEKETKTFELKINGESIFTIEASGTKEIVDAFDKKCMSGTWGLFDDWNKSIGKLLLNEIEVKMATVFRDKKGKFVDLKSKIETETK